MSAGKINLDLVRKTEKDISCNGPQFNRNHRENVLNLSESRLNYS